MLPVLDIGLKVIDKIAGFFPTPEDKAKAQLAIMQLQQDGQLKELETAMSAIIAEAQSNDPFTSRARPSFMYVFYFIIIGLVIVAPFIGVFYPEQMKQFYVNVALGFAAIPEALWWTFTTGYLGYSGMRSFDKAKGVSK
jgi:magnesium-transporting ATPase (P-type)